MGYMKGFKMTALAKVLLVDDEREFVAILKGMAGRSRMNREIHVRI
jgi:hypothetical protein